MCARRARSRFLRHKVDTVLAALRLSTGQPRRQGAAQHPRHASRATSCSRSASSGCRNGPRASSIWRRGRACACSRASTASTGSCRSLVYVPRDRYTSQVRERIGALLAQAYDGRVVRLLSLLSTEGPLVRVQFIVGRYAGRDAQGRCRRAGAQHRRHRAHLGGPPGRCHRARLATEVARRLAGANTARPSRPATPRPSRRSGRWRTSSASSGLGPTCRVAIDFYREADAPAHRIHAAVYRFGAPMRLSERVPVLENLGFSAIDERSYHITPRFADGAARRHAARHGAGDGRRRRRSISSARQAARGAASSPSSAATPTTTASTA